MKKVIYLLFILPIVIFYSCSKDETEPFEEKKDTEIVVKAFFEKDYSSDIHFDNGAKVYVYYVFFTMDILGYSYEGSGKLTKNESIILPEQTEIIEKDGEITIKPKYLDKITTIIVESKYYVGRIAHTSYSEIDGDTKFTVYFKK